MRSRGIDEGCLSRLHNSIGTVSRSVIHPYRYWRAKLAYSYTTFATSHRQVPTHMLVFTMAAYRASAVLIVMNTRYRYTRGSRERALSLSRRSFMTCAGAVRNPRVRQSMLFTKSVPPKECIAINRWVNLHGWWFVSRPKAVLGFDLDGRG